MSDDGDLFVKRSLVIPGDELSLSVSGAGGPGGQHVNKTATKVTLRWSVRDSRALSEGQRSRLQKKLASRLTKDGELLVSAEDSRSQTDNRRLARERLSQQVRDALHVPKARRKTKPTRASKERRLKGKKQRSDTKRLRRDP